MLNSIIGNNITITAFLICIAVAMILGVLTALVFMYKCRHSTSFALALAILPMVVCIVIMMVNGNIGTGVAVAGAFALVRFRSVPGTAREIAAIFTAMAIGLALGMGYVVVAVLFFIFVAIFTIILTTINFGASSKFEKQMKITIPENFDYEGLFDDVFDKYNVSAELEKIRTTNMGTLFELTYHLVFPEAKIPKDFIDELRVRNGNLNIVIGVFVDKEVL